MAEQLIELEQFVAETLRQIVAGVKTAQVECREAGAVISPQSLNLMVATASHTVYDNTLGMIVEMVEFDVEVAAVQQADRKGGLGIMMGGFAIGGSKGSGASHTANSRIRFRVPMFLPPGNEKATAEEPKGMVYGSSNP